MEHLEVEKRILNFVPKFTRSKEEILSIGFNVEKKNLERITTPLDDRIDEEWQAFRLKEPINIVGVDRSQDVVIITFNYGSASLNSAIINHLALLIRAIGLEPITYYDIKINEGLLIFLTYVGGIINVS